ncbi:U3 small nucleolar RNA-associated protein 18 homolog [Nymphaea colorata]|uniref:U3 small nucleolar RNA-associated protein 18 homolog n=1 Tax=Nymphaea colorata TaxID=210225 RepID=A0A5K1B4U1_9MAGN|nr:U3 small nucleolar RNA-associated protein 18 homolog [Nymphaea colorata]
MGLVSQNALSRKRSSDNNQANLNQDNAGETGDASADPKSQRRKQKRDASAKKKEHKVASEMQEMKKLEGFLFGPLHSSVGFGKEAAKDTGEDMNEDGVFLSKDWSSATDVILHEGNILHEDNEVDREASMSDEEREPHETRKPVWIDEEEQVAKINIAKTNRLRKLRGEEGEILVSGADYVARLRSQHLKLNPKTEWAELGWRSERDAFDDESDEENESVRAQGHGANGNNILLSSEDAVVRSTTKLLPGLLEFSRLIDGNAEDPSNGPITSVEFHRNAQLLLTAGLDKKLRFFQIDGKRNTKIQSIFLEDCPIRKASFLPDGSQAIISGRRKFFYSLDIVNAKVDRVGPLMGREEKSLESFEVSPDSSTIAFTGNEGYILLVSSKSKQLIGTLKMNGTARSLAFANDGHQLLSSGGDGHIYSWDLRTRKCFHKGIDDGCINSSALSVSKDSTVFAAGSDSGIVNVYNRDEFLGGKRKPMKALTNLTTKVDGLQFNHDGQILATFSSMKRDSVKLVHVPSLSVFSNWPPLKHNLQNVQCLDFSPRGGLMVLGNAAGKVLLYKLHHYEHA